MVKRYPHIALLMAPTGTVTEGEWVESSPQNTTVKGRLEESSDRYAISPAGDMVVWVARFFTPSQKPTPAPEKVEVNGRVYSVVKWKTYQSYNVILLR